MSQDEEFYYRMRAEEEILRACQATDSREVAFHYALGNLYLDRLFAAGKVISSQVESPDDSEITATKAEKTQSWFNQARIELASDQPPGPS